MLICTYWIYSIQLHNLKDSHSGLVEFTAYNSTILRTVTVDWSSSACLYNNTYTNYFSFNISFIQFLQESPLFTIFSLCILYLHNYDSHIIVATNECACLCGHVYKVSYPDHLCVSTLRIVSLTYLHDWIYCSLSGLYLDIINYQYCIILPVSLLLLFLSSINYLFWCPIIVLISLHCVIDS